VPAVQKKFAETYRAAARHIEKKNEEVKDRPALEP
jgi:hypothetical protein